MPVRLLVAALAGLALDLAFLPVGAWWLMPVGVAGFGLALAGCRARGALLVAAVFGVAFYFPHIWWMRAVGTSAWIALAGIEAAFYAALGPVVARLQRHRAWPVWAAGAWVVAESVRSSWPFSGMPWGRLAFGVVDTPAAPLLPWVGSTGTGLLLALLGFALAEAVLAARARRRPVGGLLLAAGVVALVGAAHLAPYRLATTGQAVVAAVQGDVPGRGDDILADFRQVTQNQVDATVGLAAAVRRGEQPRPDFVLWPENSTAVDPFADASTNAQIERAVAAIGVPVVVGALVDGPPGEVLNQGIVWDPRTGAGERYTKRHPVPYGEYIPARDLLERLGVPVSTFGDLALIPRDMVAGSDDDPLPVAGLEVADAICFDVGYDDGLYAQVEGGAQLLTVQTSNATFIFTDQVDQQFAITRARAIETGRWLVVASTNGITGVVAPDGSVVARAPKQVQQVLVEQVGLVEGVTPGVRAGSWTTRGGAALVVVGLLLTRRRSRRPGTMDDDQPRRTGTEASR